MVKDCLENLLKFVNFCSCGLHKTYFDGFEKAEVEDGDEEEGDEEHGDEVGDEDVVARVRFVNSQCCRTQHRHLMKVKIYQFCQI